MKSVLAEIRRCHDKPIFVLGSSLGGLIGRFHTEEFCAKLAAWCGKHLP